MKERPIRLKEPPIIEQSVHPGQLRWHHQRLNRQQRLPQRRLIAYRSQHDGLDPY
jgi:hypothetical protein